MIAYRPARRLRIRIALVAVLLALVNRAKAQEPVRLTLKQTVSTALQKSETLSLARLRLQVTQKEAGLTRSQFRPNLFAGSGAAYTSGFPLAAGGGAPALFSLTYQQSLFDPLARSDVHAGEQTIQQQQLAMDAVRDDLIVRVASLYLELAKVRHELDLMRGERDSAQKILDFTRERMTAGFELPIEVTRAELTAARVEQRLTRLEDQDDVLADQLRTDLNLGSDQAIEVTAEDLPASADQTVNQLVEQAMQSDAGLRQAESQRTASADHLQGERASRWPTISIVGQYNVLARYNGYDEFFKKFQLNNVIAGIQVKIPLFAAQSFAAISLAQANLRVADLTVQTKRAELSSDVRQKAHQARESKMSREVARLELDLAQQNLQVVQSQFQESRASLRDLETAQLDENEKWLAFLDADFVRQQAQLDLLRTTGQVAQLIQ